ncbi:MAG: type VI secretion system protein TssA [Phycisphaerales bacterium]|nr:MAG: type VI secretion system protein TssA [Phycisphaerales bacterium]
MSTADVEALASEIESDAPSGVDLSYDPAYFALVKSAEGTPEQQVGDSVIEAAEPNWREVREGATALLRRSHDLQLAVVLTAASVRTHGMGGLADGIGLIRRLVESRWDTLYPRLDPDDGNDPLERMNLLSPLAASAASSSDPYRIRDAVLDAVLIESRQAGRFGLRDMLLADGEDLPTSPDRATPASRELIEAAIRDADADALRAAAGEASRAAEELDTLGRLLQSLASGSAPDLKPLAALARRASASLLAGLGEAAGEGESGESGTGSDQAAGSGSPSGGSGGDGVIRSPQDVVRALDRIVAYYEKHEPSSPVPLLLGRAKRLVSRPFLEILEDMNPDAMERVYMIGGLKPPEE